MENQGPESSSSGDVPCVVFQHAPLPDNRFSTRLVKVLPRQQDGIIRCQLWHAILPSHCTRHPNLIFYESGEIEETEEDKEKKDEEDDVGVLINPVTQEEAPLPSYSCLSYTWGDPTKGFGILINDRVYCVRGNLCDFLYNAQDTISDKFFWIDALCIDQDNILERNHQVQQMGIIYSWAASVIIWLGRDFEIAQSLLLIKYGSKETSMLLSNPSKPRIDQSSSFAEPLDSVEEDSSTASFDDNMRNVHSIDEPIRYPPLNVLQDLCGKFEKLSERITSHEYWTRAWVTQEILLARQATLMAGSTTYNLQALAIRFRSAVPYVRESTFENIVDILLQTPYSRRKTLYTSGIIHLVYRFRDKECSIRRDRIYSLLALCKEGRQLEVDYNVSEKRLMEQVLGVRQNSSCFCSVAILSRALAPWDVSTDDFASHKAFAQIHMYALKLGSAACPSCGNWVPFSWTRKKGYVFCLGSACPDSQGHIFWDWPENTQDSASPPEATHVKNVYLQTQRNNKTHLLCDEGDGIEFRASQWNRVYILRFSFGTLVNLLSEEFTTNTGLNGCPNLWPTDERGPIPKEGRLCLCQEP